MTTAAVKESQWSCSIIHSVQSGFRRGLCLNDIIIISSVDQQKKPKTPRSKLQHSSEK